MARKKAEGIEALVEKSEPISIQEITMTDWFAAFALLGASPMTTPDAAAKDAYERAEAMMAERSKR